MGVTQLAIPQVVSIASAAAGGSQIPASGASLINFDATTVYVVPTVELVGNVAAAAPIVQGAALPWPTGVTCYAWVATGMGTLYLTPVNASVFPVPSTVTIGGQPISVTIGGQPIQESIIDPVTGQPTPDIPTLNANYDISSGSGIVDIPAPGAGKYIYLRYWSCFFDTGATPTIYALQDSGAFGDIDYYALQGGTQRYSFNNSLHKLRVVGPVVLAQLYGGPPSVYAKVTISYTIAP